MGGQADSTIWVTIAKIRWPSSWVRKPRIMMLLPKQSTPRIYTGVWDRRGFSVNQGARSLPVEDIGLSDVLGAPGQKDQLQRGCEPI